VRNARELGNVYVLDSLSTDGTQDLARREGAVVVERRFTDYADHKNWGLKNLPLTGDWVFILDADERITPTLREEVRRRVASPHAADGYLVNRLLLFMGQQVRHGGLYPSWNLRLFRRGRAWYEQRTVHEHMICAGPTAHTKHEMLHIRRETLSDFLAKHIRYADLESDEWVSWRLGRGGGAPVKFLFRSVLLYRQWLRRQIWPRLPGRPLLRFVYMYICRLGFMDGAAGWHVALLMACYEYMISQLYAEKLAATAAVRSAASSKPAAGAEVSVVECKGAA
jgi:hypothetical protein